MTTQNVVIVGEPTWAEADLSGLQTLEELRRIIQEWIDIRSLTGEEAARLFDKYAPKVYENQQARLAKSYQQDVDEQVKAKEEERLAERAKFYNMPVESLRVIEEAYKEKPQELSGAIEKRVGQVEQREAKRSETVLRATPISPRMGIPFEQGLAGSSESEPWKQWFAENYSSILGQFNLSQPADFYTRGGWDRYSKRYGETRYRSKESAEQMAEKTWADYLEKKAKPEYLEKWYNLSPYQRGERPSSYAPKIKTVGF